jgi:WD40 repeat protein
MMATGERRAFNFPNAGYYYKYIDLGSISPDGKHFAVRGSTAFSSSYLYFDSDTLRVIAEFPSLYGPPLFSPDSQTMLIRDPGGYKVLKTSNGIQNNRFSDGFGVRSSSGAWMYYQSGARTYHPDNQRVGVIYFPHAGKCDLYLWSLATGYPESIFKSLPEGIMGIDFSYDGKRLVTVSQAGIVQTWDLDSQTLLNESIPFDCTEPVVSQDGNLAAVLRFNQVEVIDVHSGEVLQTIGDYPVTDEVSIDSITASHLVVAANPSYRETIVDLWDLSTGSLVRQFKPLSHLYTYSNNTFCTFAWQGDRIMCGSMPIQVFDIINGRLLMSYRNTEDSTLMAISPNGSSLASCKIVHDPVTKRSTASHRIFLLDPADTSSTITMVLEASHQHNFDTDCLFAMYDCGALLG